MKDLTCSRKRKWNACLRRAKASPQNRSPEKAQSVQIASRVLESILPRRAHKRLRLIRIRPRLDLERIKSRWKDALTLYQNSKSRRKSVRTTHQSLRLRTHLISVNRGNLGVESQESLQLTVSNRFQGSSLLVISVAESAKSQP